MGQELVQYKIIQQIHLERFSGKEHAFSHRARVCVYARIYTSTCPFIRGHCAHIVRAEARFSIVKRPIVIAETYP